MKTKSLIVVTSQVCPPLSFYTSAKKIPLINCYIKKKLFIPGRYYVSIYFFSNPSAPSDLSICYFLDYEYKYCSSAH